MKNKPLKYFASTVVFIGLLAFYRGDVPPEISALFGTPAPETLYSTVSLSPQRAQHILYGDKTGGGHKYGVHAPCKSEFPQGWDDDQIIQTIERIAANDNLSWRRGRNGYYVSEALEHGVKIRVVLGPKKQNIITAYPTNRPRNPCPANDH